MKKLSIQKIVVLTALLLTAGSSNSTVTAIAKIIGIELATVILLGIISVVVILGIFKGYKVEFGMEDSYVKLTAK